MTEFRFYLAQRISALVIAPLVLGHIAVMIHAVQGGLSAAEILGRVQGSAFWAGFYGLFVIAVAVHGAIGLRTIASEWLGLRRGADAVATLFLLAALLLGGNAVIALTGAP